MQRHNSIYAQASLRHNWGASLWSSKGNWESSGRTAFISFDFDDAGLYES